MRLNLFATPVAIYRDDLLVEGRDGGREVGLIYHDFHDTMKQSSKEEPVPAGEPDARRGVRRHA